MVSFDVSADEKETIDRIVDRAVAYAKRLGSPIDRTSLSTDITTCHANGSPLRLTDLLLAPDIHFVHDVFGIRKFIDRDTGKLLQHFTPRFIQQGA